MDSKSLFCINIFIVFLILLIPGNIPAQEKPEFTHISTENGLSSGIVFQTIQDKYGFLWFATQDGLNKFDGYSFKTYRNNIDDYFSISNNDVSAICEKDGVIWAGTWGGGINKFDRVNRFIRFYHNPSDSNSLSGNYVLSMLVDHAGELWIGTYTGLSKFVPQSNSFIRFLSGVRIHRIIESKENKLYFATSEGLIILNSKRDHFEKYDFPREAYPLTLMEVFIDHCGVVWLGTHGGAYIFDQNKKIIERVRMNPNSLIDIGHLSVRDVYEDTNNNLWFCTYRDGIIKFDRKVNKYFRYNNDPDNLSSLSYNEVTSVFEDRTKILWITTKGGGINKLDLKSKDFKHYYHTSCNLASLSHNSVKCFFEDKAGTIWVGTSNGLNKFNLTTGEFEYIKLPAGSSSNELNINTICEDVNNNIWIGTDLYGLFIWNPKKNNFINIKNDPMFPDVLGYRDIREIIRSKNNDMWLGTNIGLFNIDLKKHKCTMYSKNANKYKLKDDNVKVLHEDKDGIIWFGAGGLNRLDASTNKTVNFSYDVRNTNTINNDFIISINEDDKYIWAGTPSGLNRIDKNTFKITRYSEKDGFANSCINSIEMDDNSNLWMGTNAGITKFNPVKMTVKNYDKYDGLQGNEFNKKSSYKCPNGMMLFGGINGFNIFSPNLMKDNSYPFPVVLTNFRVFDVDKYLEKDISETKEITLDYKENRISFEYAALDYTQTNKKYRYYLKGFDDQWINAGDKRNANYTNLDPGTYTFYVIGTNNQNSWDGKPASIKLTIIPPFWQTLWFRILSCLAILYSAFLFFRIKINRIEKRKKLLENLIFEKTVLNEQLLKENQDRKQAEYELIKAKEKAEKSDMLKSEFLQQMSHEIRTPINTIFNFTQLLKEDFSIPTIEERSEYVNSIEHAGNRIIRTINLILNMSELQTGTYESNFIKIDLNDHLRKIYSQFMQKAGNKNLNFNLEIKDNKICITADNYSIEQILTNLIDNAIKYTNEGEVRVKSYIRNGCAFVEISDTGIGISEEYIPDLFKPFLQEEQGYTRKYEGNGLGLALVKKYCELNNAEIDVNTSKGKGTVFTIKFKLSG